MNDILRLAGVLNEDDAYDHDAAAAQQADEQQIVKALTDIAENNGVDLDGNNAIYVEGERIEITVFCPAEGVPMNSLVGFATDWVSSITVAPGHRPDTIRVILVRNRG